MGSNPAIPTIWLKRRVADAARRFSLAKAVSVLQEALRWFGFGLCHQLPERSYIASGVQAPVCVRDTGIYVGFTIAFILIALVHKGERPRNFPPPHVWVVMALLLVFMGWDGVSSYGGFRTTTNELRLITGLGVGFSAAALVVPMLNDEVWRVSTGTRVLDPLWRFLVWLLAIPVSWLAVGSLGPLLGVAFPVLIAITVLFTLLAINLVIVSMFPAFDRRAEKWTQVVAPGAIALVLAVVEIALAGQLRIALLSVTALI